MRKKKGVSIRLKILIPTVIVIILAATTIGIVSYKDLEQSMIDMGVDQAEMAAAFAVKAADGDYLATLNEDNAYDEAFLSQQETLEQVKEKCGIAYLYTLYTDGELVYYGVDTGEEQEEYGVEFDYTYEDLQDVFEGHPFVQDFIDKTEYGDLISAYLPIIDSNGSVVSAIGCDYDAAGISERIVKATKTIIIVSALAAVLSIVILNFIIGAILKAIKKVNRKYMT